MAKFIVRESNGEFYKAIEAEDIHKAEFQLVGGNSLAMKFWGYTIEPAPVVDMFANPNWEDDFNSRMSHYHY